MDQQLKDVLLNLRYCYEKKADKETYVYKLYQNWLKFENSSLSIVAFIRSMSTNDLEIAVNKVDECTSKKCSCQEEHEIIKVINIMSVSLNATTKTYQELFLENGKDDIYLNALNAISNEVICYMIQDELAARKK